MQKLGKIFLIGAGIWLTIGIAEVLPNQIDREANQIINRLENERLEALQKANAGERAYFNNVRELADEIDKIMKEAQKQRWSYRTGLIWFCFSLASELIIIGLICVNFSKTYGVN